MLEPVPSKKNHSLVNLQSLAFLLHWFCTMIILNFNCFLVLFLQRLLSDCCSWKRDANGGVLHLLYKGLMETELACGHPSSPLMKGVRSGPDKILSLFSISGAYG